MFAPSPTHGVSEHPFTTWENAFSEEELTKLVALLDELPTGKATIGGYSPEEDYKETRESKVAWLDFNDSSSWVYDRLAWVARQLNGQFYKFDLYGFSEHMQYTIYNGEDEGHYTWHLDLGVSSNSGSPPRKLSMVLQLSDPEDYEGGSLEIYSSAQPTQVEKKRGLVAMFPSYMLHRVTPVTKGIRKTLVVWITGPAFK